ncbi:MAG: UDP-N-acetylglucosamine 2-epimerase (non-hydrolyzing) [Steroidobacteraceae bacterium]
MSPKSEREKPSSVRLLQVVGARPQFVKLAPVCRAIGAANARGEQIKSIIVHTGQHYDPGMSDVFFDELDIPQADVHLGIGSGSHGLQTGRMLERLEAVLIERRPHVVLTYGDTNSTLAATLAAAKLHLPVAHIEAGLRSFNRRMPEEVNRIVADHLSDLLFAPTPEAMQNLEKEGLRGRARQVGDVMLDAIRFHAVAARSRSRVLERLGLTKGGYLVATLHRAENTAVDRLATLLEALARLAAADRPLVLSLHPRTANAIRESGIGLPDAAGLRVVAPLSYLDMIQLVGNARIVLTDSGGLQKEAFFLGRPCITLRNETEWVETVSGGGNIVAGTEIQEIVDATAHWDKQLATGEPDFSAAVVRAFGDGQASAKIVAHTMDYLANHASERSHGEARGATS